MRFSKKIYFLLIGLVFSTVVWVYAGQPQYVPPPDFPDIPFPLDPPDGFTIPFDPLNDLPDPMEIDFPPEDPFIDLPLPPLDFPGPELEDPFPDLEPSLFPGEYLGYSVSPPSGSFLAVSPLPAAVATNTFTKLMAFPMRLPFHPAYSGTSAAKTRRTCTAATATQMIIPESKRNTVAFVNTCPYQITTRVSVGTRPVAVAGTPDGQFALVSNAGNGTFSGTVSVINIASKAVIQTINFTAPDGSVVQPTGIAVLPDGSRAYVADHQCPNSFIFIVDLTTFNVIGSIPYFCFPAAVAVTPDGSQLWVSSRGSSRVDVYDTATNAPVTGFGVTLATGIAFNPTGTRAYLAAGTSPGFIVVVDMSSYQRITSIAVGNLPHALAVTPTGRHLFVTNGLSNSVSWISTDTNTVIQTITFPNGRKDPLGLTFIR
jgi:YVTN family beta-propeller protein